MRYLNSSMKIDQLVSYLNEDKINLAPAFQRGHVWKLQTRRKLVRNIVLGKPIPAIFLYKEASGSRYSYNILDGKQRLESLILFIADNRPDVRIPGWHKYFFGAQHRSQASFYVDLEPKVRRAFKSLEDDKVREFREYSIPTIEISLDDDTNLDDVITLFVDINQQGEAVKRFDIVKALNRTDPLLKQVFDLLAQEQKRGTDPYFNPKQTSFTSVLKRLQVIENVAPSNAKIDRMWERLLEFAIFAKTHEHRKSTAVLKQFIAPVKGNHPGKMTAKELKQLQGVFSFLRSQISKLGKSRLFTDQTHSYTMITSIMRADLVKVYGAAALANKLAKFSALLDGARTSDRALHRLRASYLEQSERQTTDASRRQQRDRLFVEMVPSL